MLMIYSDPHHHLDLRSNTTPASRLRLDEALHDVTAGITMRPEVEDANTTKICVGDFFHRFSNPETEIIKAAPSARNTDFILGGNHDVVNDSSRVGSLRLLQEMCPGTKIIMPSLATPTFYGERRVVTKKLSVWLSFVPHHGTKESFAEALQLAAAQAEKARFADGEKCILFLHCNYDCEMAVKDTEMNLSKEMAEELLKVYSWIFIGHDHHPKSDFDGRVQVVGSIHPTCFSDCDSEKRCFTLGEDGDELVLKSHTLWSPERKYVEVTVDQLESVDPTVANFIKITGKASPADIAAVSKKVKELYTHPESTVYAVKSELKIVTEVSDYDQYQSSEEIKEGGVKITDIITRELQQQDKALLDLWLSLLDKAGE